MRLRAVVVRPPATTRVLGGLERAAARAPPAVGRTAAEAVEQASRACMRRGEGEVRLEAEKGARSGVSGLLEGPIHASAMGVIRAGLTPDALSAMILTRYSF